MADIATQPDSPAADYSWTHNDEWPSASYMGGYIVVGLIAGVASALLGIGSGAIIVPILSGWLHVPLKRAVGISIVTVLGVVIVGVVAEAITTTNIQWALALVLALGAQGGVRIGGWIGARISSKMLKWIFVTFLIITALKLAQIIPGGVSFGLFHESEMYSLWIITILALGVLAGILSVLLGIGGGIVVVPGLLLLIEGLSFQAARATSLTMIIPTAFSGTLVHVRQNNVLWRSVVPLVVPGFFGAIAGVALANVLPGALLRQYVFPAFVVLMAIRLAFNKAGKK